MHQTSLANQSLLESRHSSQNIYMGNPEVMQDHVIKGSKVQRLSLRKAQRALCNTQTNYRVMFRPTTLLN